MYLQWEFQDPKTEVLYHIRPFFCGDIPLHRPYIGLIHGRDPEFRFLTLPLIVVVVVVLVVVVVVVVVLVASSNQ